jgi:hypothetical protein
VPYTSLTTVASGDVIDPAWGNLVDTNLDFLANPPACRVYRTTNQSIPNAAFTILTFDAERYDTAGLHSTSVATSRITIGTAGLYLVTGHIEWGGDGDYLRRIFDVLLNGATTIARHSNETAAQNIPNSEPWSIATAYKFAANDYVELRVYQSNTSAAANNINAVTNYSPEFSATWIGLG